MFVCVYIPSNFVGFGGLMIYKFVSSFIILNIIFEVLQVLFPSNKMNNFVKSLVLIIFLYGLLELFIV